jgi:hypothetical protein
MIDMAKGGTEAGNLLVVAVVVVVGGGGGGDGCFLYIYCQRPREKNIYYLHAALFVY